MSLPSDARDAPRRSVCIPRRFTFDLPTASPDPFSAPSPSPSPPPPLSSRRRLHPRRSLPTSAGRRCDDPHSAQQRPQHAQRKGRRTTTRSSSSSSSSCTAAPASAWAVLCRQLRAWLMGGRRRAKEEADARRSSPAPPSTLHPQPHLHPHPHRLPHRHPRPIAAERSREETRLSPRPPPLQGRGAGRATQLPLRRRPSPPSSLNCGFGVGGGGGCGGGGGGVCGEESGGCALSRFLSPCSVALLELSAPPTPSSPRSSGGALPSPALPKHQRRRPQPLRAQLSAEPSSPFFRTASGCSSPDRWMDPAAASSPLPLRSESQLFCVPSTSSPPSLSSFPSSSSSLRAVSSSPSSLHLLTGRSPQPLQPLISAPVAEADHSRAAASTTSAWSWVAAHRRLQCLPLHTSTIAALTTSTGSPPPSPPPLASAARDRVSLPPLLIPSGGVGCDDEVGSISILPSSSSASPLFPCTADAQSFYAEWLRRRCCADEDAVFGRSALQSPLDLTMTHPAH